MIRYLVKRIPNTSLERYDGSRYYCEIAGGTAEKSTVETAELLAGSKYLDVQTGTWYVYDELTDAWAISAEGGSADPEVIEAAVQAWLTAHPEATTTVQDGSISYAKLDTAMKAKADAVSTLSDETSNLKSALNNVHNMIKDGGVALTSYISEWQQGTLYSATGGPMDSDTRCRTSYVKFDAPIVHIEIKSGYKFAVSEYTSQSTSGYIGVTIPMRNTSMDITPDPNHYFRFVIGLVSDEDLAVADIPEDVFVVTLYTNTDKTLTLSNKSADSKTVGEAVNILTKATQDNYVLKKVINWASGGISFSGSSAGGMVNSATAKANRRRARMIYIWDAKTDVKVKIKSGYAVNVVKYNNDGNNPSTGNYVEASAATQTEITIPISPSYQYYLLLRKTDGSDFASTDNILTAVELEYLSDHYDYNANSNIIRRNNPINMLDKLQQLNRPTRTGQQTLGTPPLTMLWFSDIHGDQVCLQNIMDFYKYYKTYISDVICTGDIVLNQFSDGTDFWSVTIGSQNILNTIGNHDTRVDNTWIGKTMAECYTEYFAPYISNWNVTYDAGKTYYYKDYEGNNIRLIVLDEMHQTAEQLTWFTATLASALSGGYHVVCAVHCRPWCKVVPFDSPWDDEITAGYDRSQSDSSATDYPQNLSEDYINAVDSFINSNGNFVCWIHGHTHYKMLTKLENHSNQMAIAVSNAGQPDNAWTSVYARIPETKSEDNFNLIGIDTLSKVIKVIKVGVDYDRYMRHIDTLCVSYDTNTILFD